MTYLRTLVLVAAVSLAACQPNGSGSNAAKGGGAGGDAKPVAVVNGKPIEREFFEFYVEGISGKPSSELSEEQRAQALENLIHAQLAAQQASREGIDKQPETAGMLELTRLNVLQQALSESYLKERAPTEQELRAEYESQVQALPGQEYRARHILVATEEFASRLVARIQKGEKFEDLARRESMDSSKDNGGDLGWFTPDRMVKPFSDAVVALKPGEITKQPVQTQYGWHVIRLEDTRDLAPPPFDSVRERLDQVVRAKKFKAYIEDLMKTAKIEKNI